MTRKTLCLIIMITLASWGLQAAIIYAVNSESRTLSRIDTQTQSVNNSFAHLGLTPNLMTLDDEHVWVVCSGDNVIQEIDRLSGAQVRYLPVAQSSNPWDVLKVDGYLYVTGLFTNTLYKISLDSGNVVASLEVGTAPEGLASSGNLLFVANTGGYQNNYAGSSVSVIDLPSFSLLTNIPVWSNPQYLRVHEGMLHVSCTGNWIDLAGKIDVIDIGTLQHAGRIDLGGRPTSIWISDDNTALVGEGMSSGYYRYNADDLSIINSESNPLQPGAYGIDGNQDMAALMKQNWGSPSVLYLRHPDLSAWQEYTLGLVSTDLKIYSSSPSASDDLVSPVQFSIYPNPVNRKGILRLSPPAKTTGEFSIFNLRGQLILRQSLSAAQTEIPLAALNCQPGVYLYRIKQIDNTISGKIVLQ